MRFEWDKEKDRENLAKHRISFETAKLVFEDTHAISFLDTSADEVRWQTFGAISGLVVMVVHTCHEEGEEEVLRLISARRATSGERRIYEAHQETG